MDTAGVMGSTELVDAVPARSFTQYVAIAAALHTKYLNRVRRTTKRTALADLGRDGAAEERWEGEGGKSGGAQTPAPAGPMLNGGNPRPTNPAWCKDTQSG
jgi:hypothetical protein